MASSSSAADASSYDPSTYWLAPERNFRSSARLHLQHLLFQNTLGFLIEPGLEKAIESSRQLKVADLGCGNGVWLTDLDRELSKRGVSAELVGYDVNPVNFPATAYLPSSVQLHKLDVLSVPLPADVIGTFDVVHVRAFASIISKSDTAPLLSAALSLLKPGGWLQWEESKAERFVVEAPSTDISSTACATISQIVKAGGDARGATFEFIGQLDQHLTKQGFEDVNLTATRLRAQDYKGWTEDYLMVWEGLAQYFPTRAQAPQSPMTRESWAEMFEKAVLETEQGVVIHQSEIVTVVGRKPL